MALSYSELMQAALVGVMRQVENLMNGRKDAHGLDPTDGWTPHIEGACGELAAAKALGLFWHGKGKLRAADVGELQVRTALAHDRRLILHPDDPDDAIFVFVTGRAPWLRVRGWIRGKDGKQERFWSDPTGHRPAFFVPADALRPVEELENATHSFVA